MTDRITTTIKREWLREIVAGRKKVEYRERKPYWTERLGRVSAPFELRLINGMSANAPEVTVVVRKVSRNAGQYELHLGKILKGGSIGTAAPAAIVKSSRGTSATAGPSPETSPRR